MKRVLKNTLGTVAAAGANVYTNDTAKVIVLCSDNTTDPLVPLLDPIPYGGIDSIESFTSQTEHTQIVTIGASTTKEVITASTRYKVSITSKDQTYESDKKTDAIHAYTSPAVLSGTAATDRANVYTVLVSKINAFAANNVTAYLLTRVDFTGGTSVGNAATNFLIGETVTQETSSETAKVAKCSITSGTFYGDDAAGTIWLYNLSTTGSAWLTTAKTLSGAGTVAGISTNCVVTQTNATTVHATGICIVDDAGYFTSNKDRGGISAVYIDGFSTDVVETQRAGRYSMGIGSVMLALAPVYNRDASDVVSGDADYDFPTAPDASKTYTKIVINCKGKNKDTLGPVIEELPYQMILYADESNGTNLTNLLGALATAKAK